MNVARAAVRLVLGKVGGMVVSFLALAYFSRTLGAFSMGVFFLYQALVGLLSLPADAGLRAALEKRISEGGPAPALLGSALAVKAVPLMIAVGTVLAAGGPLAAYVGRPIAVPLAITLVVHELARSYVRVLYGELRVAEAAAVPVIRRLTWAAVGVVGIQYGLGVTALIYGWITGIGAELLVAASRASVPVGAPTRDGVRSLVQFAKFDLVSGTGAKVFSWVDVAVVGLFLTQTAVGAYEIAWKITAVALVLTSSLRTVVFPQISAWDAADEDGRIESLLPTVYSASLFLVVPAFFGVATFARPILAVVFGPDYAVAAQALVVLTFLAIVRTFEGVVGKALQAIDRPDRAAVAILAGILANVALNVVLVWSFDLLGAALATLASYALVAVIGARYLYREIEFAFPARDLGLYLAASLAMTAVLAAYRRAVVVDGSPELAGGIALGVAVYCTGTFLHPDLRRRVREGISQVV